MEILRRDATLRLCEKPQSFDHLLLVPIRYVLLTGIKERFAKYMVNSAQELLKAAEGVASLTLQIDLSNGGRHRAGAARHKYPNFRHAPRTEI